MPPDAQVGLRYPDFAVRYAIHLLRVHRPYTIRALCEPVESQKAMLCLSMDLQDFAIGTTNGTVGEVKDFCFDDEA